MEHQEDLVISDKHLARGIVWVNLDVNFKTELKKTSQTLVSCLKIISLVPQGGAPGITAAAVTWCDQIGTPHLRVLKKYNKINFLCHFNSLFLQLF